MKKLKNQFQIKKVICNGHKECPERFTCMHSKPHHKDTYCNLKGIDLSNYDTPKDHPCHCSITKNEERKIKIKKIEDSCNG